MHNKFLEGIEADAFDRGNIAFRFWEAEQKMDKQDKKEISEKHLTPGEEKKKEKIVHALKKQGYKKSDPSTYAIATAAAKKEESVEEAASCAEENVNENKEVVVNDALKNSVVYVKDDRACNDLYNNREETIFQDLLKKFGIKK